MTENPSDSVGQNGTDTVNTASDDSEISHTSLISTPFCDNLVETSEAVLEREKLNGFLLEHHNLNDEDDHNSPLTIYILRGLACTVGSALEETPPSDDDCLGAFLVPNRVGLTVGARAWTKHAHRSGNSEGGVASQLSWWGQPKGPQAAINDMAVILYRKIMANATWRNLHWLPHQILAYEVRVKEGYGMRWSKDMSQSSDDNASRQWQFRGYVEPMMENGHELGWRH